MSYNKGKIYYMVPRQYSNTKRTKLEVTDGYTAMIGVLDVI